MKAIVTSARWLVGALFIFSGLIKANDPLGLAYKLEDYYEVFGNYPILSLFDNGFFHSSTLEFSIILCLLEVLLGISLILGTFPKLTSWITLILIIVFTFLTGFSAITGEVQDCGCFGDALPLTPTQSFIKDIILTFLILIIFFYRKGIKSIFKPPADKIVIGLSVILALIFTLYAYNHLPYWDFRAYKTGGNVCELMIDVPPTLKYFYKLKNKSSGEEQEFEKFPENWDADWDYLDVRTEELDAGLPAKIQNFSLSDVDGLDVTEDFLGIEGYKFLLISYNIKTCSRSRFNHVNELQVALEKEGIPFYGVSASSDADVEAFRHEQQAGFEFYSADETELKTIIRSNPGLVMMKDCTIVGKWHWRDMPSPEAINRMMN